MAVTSSRSSSSRCRTAARCRRKMLGAGPRIGGALLEQRRDLLKRELQPAVDDDVLQPDEIGGGVEPVAGPRALARHDQPDLVVVVQRPHRHPEQVGHLAHRQQGVDVGHGRHALTFAPHLA
jgi:hypothetical protein